MTCCIRETCELVGSLGSMKTGLFAKGPKYSPKKNRHFIQRSKFVNVTPNLVSSRLVAPPPVQRTVTPEQPVTPSILFDQSRTALLLNLHNEVDRLNDTILKQKEMISKLQLKYKDMLVALQSSATALSKANLVKAACEVPTINVVCIHKKAFRSS